LRNGGDETQHNRIKIYEHYRREFGEEEEGIRRCLNREKFVLPAGTDYYSLYE